MDSFSENFQGIDDNTKGWVFCALAFILFGILILSIVCYFLPTIVAYRRRKRNRIPIFILNFFLGWTFVGWVIALVWAFIEDR